MKFPLPPSTLRRIAWGACFILVAVAAFSLSGTQKPPLELDPSWNVAIEYATAHHWQFGTQIVFTFGPLGFLAAPTSLGHLVAVRIAFAIFWSLVVALTAITLAKRLPGWVRFVFLGWLVVFTLSEGLDQTAFWVLASGTLLLLMDGPRPRWRPPLYIAVIIALALIKTSFFTAGFASLALVAVCWIRQGKFKAATGLAAGAAGGFILGWIACGQSAWNLFPWIRSGFELESGYSGAMNLAPKTSVLCFALAALALFVGALIRMVARGSGGFPQWAAAITLAQYGFLAWKEGFTRCGDWHAFVFLWFLPLGMSFFLLDWLLNRLINHPPGAPAPSRPVVLHAAFAASIVLCLAAAHFQIPNFAWQQVRAWPRRIAQNASGMAQSVTGHWDSLYADSRETPRMMLLDHAQDLVGNESVDVMNYLQVAAVANGMNYQPRPVFQGFVAYTPALQRLNEEYFQSPRRPRFVLLDQQATDGRFPALEDASALDYVLNNYVPVGRDGRFLVLKQQTAQDLQFQLVHEETLSFEKLVDLRPSGNEPLFMTVAISPNLAGRVAQTLYQQQILFMRVLTNHREQRYRVVPSMAERPFLASPVLDSNFDVMNLETSQPGKQLESVAIERPAHSSFEFKPAIRLRLYTAPGFPLAAKRIPASRIVADVQGRVFWPPPASVESASPARLTLFHATAALRVSAPSKIVMEIPDNVSSFSGYFGVPEEGYAGDASAPGVIMSVVVRDQSGKITGKMVRVLNPAVRADDRGRFAFTVPIDNQRDRTLTLTTASTSTAADGGGWSVWSRCRFEEVGAQ